MFTRLAVATRCLLASDRYLVQKRFSTVARDHVNMEVEDSQGDAGKKDAEAKVYENIPGDDEIQLKVDIGYHKERHDNNVENEMTSLYSMDFKKSLKLTRPNGPYDPKLLPFHHQLGNSTPREAMRILREIKDQGHNPTVITYNLVLKNLAKSSWTDKCLTLLQEMEDAGIEPTVVTYTTIMRAFVRLKDYESVFEFMDKMKAKGVPMSQVTYGTLLNTCALGSFVKKAEDIFSEMISAKIMPNSLAYGSMARVFGESQQWERLDSLLKNMEKDGLQSTEHIYAILLHSYSKAAMIDKMMDIKRVMENKRIRVDTYCYNALIHALINLSRYNDAMEMIYEAQNRGSVDGIIYSHMMYLYSLNKDTMNCRRLLEMLLSNGIPVINRTCSAYLRAHAATGDGEECATFMGNMEKNLHLKPSASHFNMIVDELDTNGFEDLAEEFFKEGRRRTGFQRIYEQSNITEPILNLSRTSYSMAKFALKDHLTNPEFKGRKTKILVNSEDADKEDWAVPRKAIEQFLTGYDFSMSDVNCITINL